MDDDVRALLESAEFQRYHQERQTPRFNVFDVLRNAEYEIRHSNVLAWLLTPGQTHGLGDEFLRRFMESLAPRPPQVESWLRDGGVTVTEVKREFHYADVVVFLADDKEGTLLVIENKVGDIAANAIDQTRGYVETLAREYPRRTLHGVLLTASEQHDGTAAVIKHQERARGMPMSHVSWGQIREIIANLPPDALASDEVRAFISQYREAVDRIVLPRAPFVEELLKAYDGALERLANDAAAIGPLDEPRRTTLDELIGLHQQSPHQLRSATDTYLKSKGLRTSATGRRPLLWLDWKLDPYQEDAVEEGASVSGAGKRVRSDWVWSIGFSRRDVTLHLMYPHRTRTPTSENVIRFMKEAPIRALLPPGDAGRCLMENPQIEYGYRTVYKNQLLDGGQLANLSVREATERLRERLDEFFASDCKRIEFYFRCLAFEPTVREEQK